MKVAIYGPYNEQLYGTLNLTPTGIVPEPFGPPHQREGHLEQLHRILKNWRPAGLDDVAFLKKLPRMLQGRAVLLDALADPTPGFADVAEDHPDGDTAGHEQSSRP